MSPNLSMYALNALDPDNADDPTKRLMQAMLLSRDGGDMDRPAPAPVSASTPAPAPVRPQPIQPSGGSLYTGPVVPPSPPKSILDDPSATADVHPAGFSSTGMPTEFPATSRMNQARNRLQQAMHPQHATRDMLIRNGIGILGTLLAARGGNSYAGAGAAEGFEKGTEDLYNRQQTNIGRANEQYQFEAGQEERQRESALRERVAMTQIESQRAYRDLLIEMRKRGQDVSQQTAMRGQDIGAQKAGYNVESGPTPGAAPTLTPKSVDELPEVQQAMIALNQERQKMMQQNEAGGALNLQAQRWKQKSLDARLMGIQAMKELRQQSMAQSWQLGMAKLTEPTGAVRSMGETAATVLPHIEEFRKIIDDADSNGLLGPMRGRVSDFLAGKIGSTGDKKLDNLLGRLRSEDKLVNSAMLRTHFGAKGGTQMYGNFVNMLDSGKATKEALNGALDTYKSFATGYAQAGGVDLDNFNAGGSASYMPSSTHVRSAAPPQPTPARTNLKKQQPNGLPAGAKVVEWKDIQ